MHIFFVDKIGYSKASGIIIFRHIIVERYPPSTAGASEECIQIYRYSQLKQYKTEHAHRRKIKTEANEKKNRRTEQATN
jgi:TnpA family transposase